MGTVNSPKRPLSETWAGGLYLQGEGPHSVNLSIFLSPSLKIERGNGQIRTNNVGENQEKL